MHVMPMNNDSATCDPVVLREGPTVRLVFKPTLVRNQQDDSQPVLGEFVYQKKKKKADEWEDDVSTRINDIAAGTGLKLALKPWELDSVIRHVTALYGFYKQHRIPRAKRNVQVAATAPTLTGNAVALIQQIIDDNGVDGLASLLEWAATSGSTRKTVDQLVRLNVDSLQRISALAGISSLKKVLDLWEREQDNKSEGFWQDQLTKQPFVLSQVFSAPVLFLKEKPYVGGKGIENVGGKYPDYLMQTVATGNVLIIELKEPTTRLLGSLYRKPDVYGPSDEVGGAVVQVARYKDRILKHYYPLSGDSDVEFKAFSPQCLVIAGHTKQLGTDKGKIASFELFRNNLRECQLITYDELFEKTARLVQLLEGTTEEEPPF